MLKLFILNLSKFLIACFILAAGVFGFLWLKNTEDEVSVEKLEETSFFVQTQSVVFNNYNPENIAFGSVSSSRQANLKFPIFGEVLSISKDFKSGGYVKKGSILAQLDNFTQLSNLNDLEIQLSLNNSQINEINSEIQSDKLQLNELNNQLNIREKQKTRIIKMIDGKASTDSALDEILLAVSNAKSLILSREQNIRRLTFKKDQINLSNKRLQISIDKAKRAINDTILKAPFDGSLSSVNIALGENLLSSQLIGRLSDLNYLEVSFNVPSQVFANFENIISKEVEVIWEQGSNEVSTLKGTISRRDSIVNPQDGGGKVFASLPSPSQNFSSIPPGAFVKVRYPVGTLYNVVKLPEEAIYEGNSVFIIRNGRAQKRLVSISHKEPGYIYLKGELSKNDEVVISRLAGIGEGVKLRSKYE